MCRFTVVIIKFSSHDLKEGDSSEWSSTFCAHVYKRETSCLAPETWHAFLSSVHATLPNLPTLVVELDISLHVAASVFSCQHD